MEIRGVKAEEMVTLIGIEIPASIVPMTEMITSTEMAVMIEKVNLIELVILTKIAA